MAVKFQPKPDKPHIRLHKGAVGYFLWPHIKEPKFFFHGLCLYCLRVNPHHYKTPGEAARALHYGRENK